MGLLSFTRRKLNGIAPSDFISGAFYLMSVIFLGAFLGFVNQHLGYIVSWYHIVFFSSVLGIVLAYVLKTKATLFGGLFGLMSWWFLQAGHWQKVQQFDDMAIIVGLLLFCGILYMLAPLHKRLPVFSSFSSAYLLLGLLIPTFVLFIFSTQEGLRMIEDMTKDAAFYTSWHVTIPLIILLLALLGLTFYTVSTRAITMIDAVGVVLILLVFSAMLFAPHHDLIQYGNYWSRYRTQTSNMGILWTLILNVLLLAELIGIILSGYMTKESWRVNLGVSLVGIFIYIKYFDWFLSFLDKSIFFIGAGVLLFVLGWFMEKGRKYVLAASHESH